MEIPRVSIVMSPDPLEYNTYPSLKKISEDDPGNFLQDSMTETFHCTKHKVTSRNDGITRLETKEIGHAKNNTGKRLSKGMHFQYLYKTKFV